MRRFAIHNSPVVRSAPQTGFRPYRSHGVAVMLALLVASACNGPRTQPMDTEPVAQFGTMPPIIDSVGLNEIAVANRDRVVLYFFWSRFDDDVAGNLKSLARLAASLKPEGLTTIACNLDDPGDWQSHTQPLLMSVSAEFPVFVLPEESREPVRTWLQPQWRYDTPTSFIFARGQPAVMVAKGASWIEIDRAVRQALSGSDLHVREASLRRPPQLTLALIDARTHRIVRRFRPIECASPNAADPMAPIIAREVRTATMHVAVLPFSTTTSDSTTAADLVAARLSRTLVINGLADVVEVNRDDLTRVVPSIDGDWQPICEVIIADYLIAGYWSQPPEDQQ